MAVLGVLAGAVAACGGGSSSPSVAGVGTTGTTAAATASQGGSSSANYADELAYAQCMRTHGEPGWPDPNSQGGFDFHGTSGVDFNSSTYTSATKACQHLLPNGGQVTQAQLQQGLTAALKYAQCMRTHGLPTFPDPTMSAGGSGISMGPPSGISPNSPQLQAAQKACRSLQPGGDGGG